MMGLAQSHTVSRATESLELGVSGSGPAVDAPACCNFSRSLPFLLLLSKPNHDDTQMSNASLSSPASQTWSLVGDAGGSTGQQ